ncbi:MarR family winged helix-turn-helix transcriptional regulator [Cytobacillus sp. IB215665]|uniref:MarR family winged helix-turn-helix transcriptional regulator n=1 Tax=Cytobacillus sp. IB215665 TaxID=3097357 RepID=UPI002A0AF6AC|nr:MarR family transcriptional regulator [Cytobacillus sp. IB215665]MDX8365834.1 MarR family transcriptional regulator [Cytobacillus sp. IB215665]
MDNITLFNKLIKFTDSVYSVTYELSKDEKPQNITSVQYDILVLIALKKRTSPSQVSDCLHISMPNVSRELKKLGEHNLIKRSSDVEDRRKQYISLSKEGEKLIEEIYNRILIKFNNRIKNPSQKELEEIDRAIDVLQKYVYFD